MKKQYELIVDNKFRNIRLDVAISKILPDISRSSLKNHCEIIYVNEKVEKLSYKCKGGERVKFELLFEEFTDLVADEIPLDIIYEDENYIVINKPYNMVVHPAKGNFRGTVVNALLALNKNLAKTENDFRPGIVHRLDKETSGLLVVAKNQEALEYLSHLFKTRNIKKKYHAIVKGVLLPHELVIDNYLGRDPRNRKKIAVLNKGGKRAITLVKNIKQYKNYSYLDVNLLTGRTHQIRVHLSNYGYPILGDKIYSRRDALFPDIPLCLVAYRLTFFDKFSEKKFDFKISDPPHFKTVLKKIKII